jgi:7,8-dihydropterin-6-yl-methyl-4-(beta-D-ribofuranosyl)aminobenzene 5'-phosphate synthase
VRITVLGKSPSWQDADGACSGYLVEEDGFHLLLDCGNGVFSKLRRFIDYVDVDAVVISHLHADHVGGLRSMARRTFSFAAEPFEPRGVPAHVPAEMRHDRASVVRTTGPQVVAPGVAVLPPLLRMLFWIGPVAEQALVVNVRGFGFALVTGCGHPQIERILGVTEQVLDVNIHVVRAEG